jgi:eukaryotic-like serine/threonine-protein kinase
MEYLEGETLGQRLARLGRLSTAEAVAIIGPAASALSAAHAAGIVHRDLKPDNIFLARQPGSETERVILLDFGVAKLRGDLSNVSSGAALLGTPAYMSPEQCRGIGEIDARTDVYALGTILYQMLCGRVPFVSSGYGDVLLKHLLEPPVPPGSLVPEIPSAVQAMILRALAKEPNDRFASMDEAWAALCSATPTPGPIPLQPEPTETPVAPPPLPRKPAAAPARPARRRRFLPRALATTALMASVGAWVWSRGQPEAVRGDTAEAAAFPPAASIETAAGDPAAAGGPTPAPAPTPEPSASAETATLAVPDQPAPAPGPAEAPPAAAPAGSAAPAVEAAAPAAAAAAAAASGASIAGNAPGARVQGGRAAEAIAGDPAAARMRPAPGAGRGPRFFRWSRNRMKARDLPPGPWRRGERRPGPSLGGRPQEGRPLPGQAQGRTSPWQPLPGRSSAGRSSPGQPSAGRSSPGQRSEGQSWMDKW